MTDDGSAGGPVRGGVLARLQRGLEALYRVRTGLDVEAFVLDESSRAAATPTRTPREQLLLTEDAGELHMGLYVDQRVVDNLAQRAPRQMVEDEHFDDFCLAVEGVSHFIYVALCASSERPVSALELELQAEVDKFLCGLLVDSTTAHARAAGLRRRLFEDVRLADDLDADERSRYVEATARARAFALGIERRHLAARRLPDLVAEARRFYRLGLDGKLDHIARAA